MKGVLTNKYRYLIAKLFIQLMEQTLQYALDKLFS